MARKFFQSGTQFGLRGVLCLLLSAFLIPTVPAQAQVVAPPVGLVDSFFENGLNPLSDIVTAGVSISNRKVYRQAFAELARERSYYDYLNSGSQSGEQGFARSVKGQSPQLVDSNTFRFELTGRGGEFASILPVESYDLESYGFQAGGLLKSNCSSSLGMVIGYERGYLRNDYDLNKMIEPIRADIDALFPKYAGVRLNKEKNSTRFDDIYVGLYYGQIFQDNIDFRSFIGGGYQRFKTDRNDQKHHYSTTYGGGSFELNFELGRYYSFRPGGVLFRPYVGLDIEHATVKATQEDVVGNLFRFYDRTSLANLFCRLGLDLEKRWRRVDLIGGFGYTFMCIGKRYANTGVFYPNLEDGDLMRGARLGRSSWNFKVGLNWHLNPMRTKTIYIDYFADIHPDRTGDTGLHTASVGYGVRY